jgi:hypothetical protein
VTTDLAGLVVKLERVRNDLTSEALLRDVGMRGKQLGTAAVNADTGGDARMSNWRRGRPINLATRFDVQSESLVQIAPSPRARGPVKVLTYGREAGMSRGTRRRASRPVSASRGKGTWVRAVADMEAELPKVVQRHTVSVLRKHF